MKDFLAALRTSRALDFRWGQWHLDGLALDNELVDGFRPEVERALQEDPSIAARLETVTFFDEGWYESAPFLRWFPRLEQLVLYGNTLLSDLSALAGHPSLKRVAFTNYCGLDPAKGGLGWLDDLPQLEELVLFERYLELDGWEPSERMLSRLRSLWINWGDFARIRHDTLARIEALSIYVQDIDELLELATIDEDDEHVKARHAQLRACFAPLGRRPGLKLRLLFDRAESAELRRRVDDGIGPWIPDGVDVERYWKGQVMPLLNDGYGFIRQV